MSRWALLFLVLVAQVGHATAIPPEVKNTIAFVFVPNGNGEPVPSGTCFFIAVRDQQHPEKGWGYLVTAKHVLESSPGVFYPRVWIRINKRAGGTDSLQLVLNPTGPQKNVFVHDDHAVDIAVVPVPQPDRSIYEVQALSDDLIVDSKDFEALDIREGSDVFFSGMFLPFLGSNRNYPIVRFGKVALVTNEKILWGGVPTDLYLIETFSFGGNSGSPVFFYLGSDRKPGTIIAGPPILKLAGVMSGYFGDWEPVGNVETHATLVSKVNWGIAAVVPAYKLHDILFGADLEQIRHPTK